MCRRVQCPKCKKPTFAGCGMHVEQVLGDVPKSERCDCSAQASASGGPSGDSVVSRFFGGLFNNKE